MILVAALTALAQTHPVDPADLPPELVPWVAWVRSQHPDLACATSAGEAACVWPGVCAIDATDSGARFRLQVTTDREIAVPLPGGPRLWPQEVRAGTTRPVVLDVEGVPMTVLGAGTHVVEGDIPWAAVPQSLPVPNHIAQVALTLNGDPVLRPRRSDDGTLRLGAGDDADRDENRLDIEVYRRIQDAVPVVVTTRLVLRAAGAAREVALGDVRVPGTHPVSLTADVPARFADEGRLVAQVRPGTWTLTFEAIHDGPVSQLSAPKQELPWPEQEVWVVASDDRVRAANLSGPPGVDAGRTNLPQDAAWRGLPTWLVSPDQPLLFEELRRGEPQPPPNQLTLNREMWLDLDGEGLTVRDTFSGQMQVGWRLDAVAPFALGHVNDATVDQVVTLGMNGAAGVETRNQAVSIVAESRVDGRPSRLPAVGWDTDVHRLSATLHLPPGWRLLTGTGVDNLEGSVLDRWTLFDLFFVLVVSMALGKLLGWPWAIIGLGGMVLSRHEPDAPSWLWALAILGEAIWRIVPKGNGKTVAAGVKWALIALLLLVLLPFSVTQVQVNAFPALEQPYVVGGEPIFSDLEVRGGLDWNANFVDEVSAQGFRSEAKEISQSEPWDRFSYKGKSYLSAQVDPNAVVQTGPGVPSWSWHQQPLEWSGPVDADHEMRLLLLGPRLNLLLAILRVTLLLALALRLLKVREWFGTLPPPPLPAVAPAGAALLLAALASPAARAEVPDAELLRLLEERLTQPAACAPSCVTPTRVDLRIDGGKLSIAADVSVGADSAWPLPGPADIWQAEVVLVDGARTTALRRLSDGFHYVRVPQGVHRVEVEGALGPATDALTLQWGNKPHRVTFEAEGWLIDGLRADGTVDGAVQITRALQQGGDGARGHENLSPWVEVRRSIDLGLPWRVRTEITRQGAVGHPLALRVPLLPGESVTDGTFEVQGGFVQVTMGRDVTHAEWLSTLETADTLRLSAPSSVPWTERWTLSCSPIFRCSASGPAPLHHVDAGSWSPAWLPWPGETVDVSVYRPEAVRGQTTTIDKVRLDVTPGRRQLEGTLSLRARTSQGGTQVIGLPAEARLLSVTVDGVARPIQAREGNEVHVPLNTGAQELNLAWTQPHPARIWDTVPAIDLHQDAVNVTVAVHMPMQRWIALVSGPRWGPVPLFWVYVLLVGIAAPLLARLPWNPLSTFQWALLGLGMTQVPVVCPMIVAVWFVAVAYRQARPAKNVVWFDLYQLLLVGWTLVALVCLYAAVHVGLLFDPDVQVTGNGSSNHELVWFADRSSGLLPQPTLVSFPRWVWSVLMLLWALWLAARFVRWVPWAWKAFGTDGYFKLPPPPAKAPSKATPAPSGKPA